MGAGISNSTNPKGNTGMPVYLSHKGFVAEDGEQVPIVEFESEEGMREPEQCIRMHVAAEQKGPNLSSTEFRIQARNVVGETVDQRSRTAGARTIR